MKKQLTLLLAALTLMGCNNSKIDDINILAPTGAPAVAFYNYKDKENFTTNSTPLNIVSNLNKSSPYTVIAIDTVSGIKAINNGAPYKIAATITFGNFYLCATGNDQNATLDVDDSIVLFGKGTTPDLLFHYLYGDSYDQNITYVDGVTDAAAILKTGKTLDNQKEINYVLIAQPLLFATLKDNQDPNKKVYQSLQELYATKTDGLKMMQASIFIKKTLSKEATNKFLDNLKTDINIAISNPSLLKDAIGSTEEAKSQFGILGPIATAVTSANNGMGLGFAYAKDSITDLNNYLSIFGLGEINEKNIF